MGPDESAPVGICFMPVTDRKVVKNRLHLDLTCGAQDRAQKGARLSAFSRSAPAGRTSVRPARSRGPSSSTRRATSLAWSARRPPSSGRACAVQARRTRGRVHHPSVRPRRATMRLPMVLACHGEALGHGSDDLQAVLADPRRVRGVRGRQHLVAVPDGDLQMAAPAMRSCSRTGPGAYLRALVTSSLTTSWERSMARADTVTPCRRWTRVRNLPCSLPRPGHAAAGPFPSRATVVSAGAPSVEENP